MHVYAVLGFLAVLTNGVYSKAKIRQFPKDFWFGASTSAYQIEGGWRQDGKSKSIWDVAVHGDPCPVAEGNSGDVAADSYYLYKRDVQIIKDLGLHFYKFSIAWTRILPNGFADKINQQGIDYYTKLIDELLSHNIEPVATIYHWDLPHKFQMLGGWTNNLIIDWFNDYANVLFEKFASKVKYWITINDPREICFEGYGSTTKAPMLNMTGIAEYMCTKNVLLAHAKAWHTYDEKYRKVHGGSVGIAIGFVWYEPASDTVDDHEGAVDARMFNWGQFAHPIFSRDGDFPKELIRNVARKSAEQGFTKSRLPELSSKEVSTIRGTADFLGVNIYGTKLVYRDASLDGMYAVPSFMDDMSAVLSKDTSWTQSASNWLQEVPWGFFKLFMEIKKLYENPPIFITGNGWSTTGGLLDEDRISALRKYLNALLDAIDEGCDIKCYSVYSLIDSFEWMEGFKEKFGLFEVDFSSSEKTRTPRKSAFIYKQIVTTRTLDPNFEPEKYIVEAPSNVDKGKTVEDPDVFL